MEFFIKTRDGHWLAARVTNELQTELSNEFRRRSRLFRERDAVDFDPGYKPDDEEVFVVKKFSLDDGSAKVFSNSAGAPALDMNKFDSYGVKAFAGVSYNSSGRPNHIVYISLPRSTVITKNSLHVMFDKNTLKRSYSSSIIIPDRVDAVFHEGELFFDSYAMANRVITLVELITEATDDEVKQFVGNRAFICDDKGAVIGLMDRWCRKRVAMLQSAGVLGTIEIKRIVAYGKEHKVALITKLVSGKRKIVLPGNRKELKGVLHLLCDDFLDSGLTDKRYRTNSKIQVA